MVPGKLFIVSAPSGAGKTSLVQAVLPRLTVAYPIERVITYTTKKPRVGERDAIDYHFLSQPEFEQRIDQGFFLEWSLAYNAYYGSPRSVQDQVAQGRSFLMILDRVGALQVAAKWPEVVLIWLHTLNFQQLEDRIRLRGKETEEQLRYRLARAQVEIEGEEREKKYKYHLLNDDFSRAQEEFEKIIVRELLSTNKASRSMI